MGLQARGWGSPWDSCSFSCPLGWGLSLVHLRSGSQFLGVPPPPEEVVLYVAVDSVGSWEEVSLRSLYVIILNWNPGKRLMKRYFSSLSASECYWLLEWSGWGSAEFKHEKCGGYEGEKCILIIALFHWSKSTGIWYKWYKWLSHQRSGWWVAGVRGWLVHVYNVAGQGQQDASGAGPLPQ